MDLSRTKKYSGIFCIISTLRLHKEIEFLNFEGRMFVVHVFVCDVHVRMCEQFVEGGINLLSVISN